MIINQFDIDRLQDALNREINNRAERHVTARNEGETDRTPDEVIAEYKKNHARSITINVPLTTYNQIDTRALLYLRKLK